MKSLHMDVSLSLSLDHKQAQVPEHAGKKALTGRYKKTKDKTTTNTEAGQEPRNDGQQLGRGVHASSSAGRPC